MGIDLTSIGIVNPEKSEYEELKKIDFKNGIYKKILIDQGKIIGSIFLGDRKGLTSITQLMSQKIDITPHKNVILNDEFNFTFFICYRFLYMS